MRAAGLCLVLLALLTACSTVPRHFMPVLSDSNRADPGFSAMLQYCTDRVAAGERSDFARSGLATAGVGAAVGYGAGAIIFAESLSASTVSPDGVVGLTLVAMPVIGILAAVGYSRHVRARHENEIQTMMSRCLAQNGYQVEDWVLVE